MGALDEIRARLDGLEAMSKELEGIVAEKDQHIDDLTALLKEATEGWQQAVHERDALAAILDAERCHGVDPLERLRTFLDAWHKADPDGYNAFTADLVARTRTDPAGC